MKWDMGVYLEKWDVNNKNLCSIADFTKKNKQMLYLLASTKGRRAAFLKNFLTKKNTIFLKFIWIIGWNIIKKTLNS